MAIARALATHPKIILADEPTANLDSRTGAGILELMKEINRSFHTTFVFSTHDKKVIAKADRLVRIEDGRVRRLGMRTDDGWVLVKERQAFAERRAPANRRRQANETPRDPDSRGGAASRADRCRSRMRRKRGPPANAAPVPRS